ncbi:HD domain-containing protein, partial [Serratia plymuthica]|uniref:HD domain-containing protein n=1 Tax=Serratia plymuthica TaxID=82996 RepID=UPI001927CC11
MNLIGTFDEKLIGKILDPIHGIIRITDIEKKVIDHPLFQRLRNIRQNTFLYKVFPSAVHSRFEHSIGVMHLSYEILKNLALNTARYKKKDYEQGNLYTKINNTSDNDIQNLRLAALLHDIGHGPLAHQFDDFALTKEEFDKHLVEDDRFEKISKLCKGKRLDHEHISCI